jgi:hypothetical protein
MSQSCAVSSPFSTLKNPVTGLTAATSSDSVVCKVKSWLSQLSVVTKQANCPISPFLAKAGSDFDRVSALGGDVVYGGGAVEFVPGEGAALDGSLQGAEQDDGKNLAIGEALQPHLA